MKTVVRTGCGALAMLAMVSQSWAGGLCARPDEAMALKTAAKQQQLMVAALTCHDIDLYNRFVISFQRELQDSDAALLTYFQRTNPRTGTAAYHTYKTELANGFSLMSLRARSYCAEAKNSFDTALDPDGPRTLAEFISNQSVSGTEAYAPCGATFAGGDAVTGGSANVRARMARNPD